MLYLIIPLEGDEGLCAVVPEGISMASILELRSKLTAGDIVPIPNLPSSVSVNCSVFELIELFLTINLPPE